jgi:hypothetical protein
VARRPLNSKRIALNHEALFAAADKRQAATRRAIVRALDVAYRSVTNAEATAAWKQSPNALMRAIDWDGVAEAMGAQPGTYGVYKADTAGTLFGQTYLSGARVAVDGMEQQLGQTIGLNLTVDQSIAYGQQRAGALISGIQQSQLSAVRDTLGLALEQGIDVGSTGRILRGSVGLSPRQATALANYERGLTELYTTGRTNVTLRGLGRPLADARYSLDKLSEARIEEMVDRYRERLVNYRAEMIARTELARSANQGAYEEQMSHAADGLFGARSANRIWLTTPDDRLCEDCDAMDGQTISFLDSFEYDAGADDEEPGAGETIIMDVPPLHPNCRCTTILEITDESMEEAFAADTDINDLVDFQGFDEEAFVDDVVADEPMSAEMNDQYVGVGPMSDDDVVSFLYDNVELLDPSRSGLDYYATELPHGKTYRGIANAQGFDGAAALGTAEDLAAEVARGGTAIYRGVAEATHVDAYVNGTMFGSTGMSGTGAYFSTSIDEAFMYAGGAIEDTTITAVLRADARTITYDDAVSLMEQQRRSLAERLMMTEPAEGWESLTLEQRTQMGMDSFFMSNAQTDVGNVAAMNGYDAIIRTNAQTKESHVIVLNRTALVIQS